MSFGSSRRSKSSVNAEHAGRRDNVPATRLRGPWSSVAAYDDLMANWQRLNDYEIDDTEEVAAGEVFDGLIPKEVATYYDSFVRNGATVRDSDALERLMRQPMSDILEQVQWFKRDDVLELSAEGTLLIARHACAANPVPILDRITAEEAEIREHCKRGREYKALDGSGKDTSPPEREYELYRKHYRPVHELLRGWCGHRSVTFCERLTAADAEVRRLNILLAEVIDELRQHNAIHAEGYEREHNDERIRPETVRPVVDRPLAPWEIPAREVRVRAPRW
ncbi:hypothetical protein [Mycobacterium avium]|nr:hypothetical protein [Mycobacterium avium]KBR60926.1 hypothetical protein X425_03439 [Mycobacterium avium XTB13-223]KDP03773.1 hypothetical protein MAV101_20800 [Mycobacterium avium subsp. hominissuis 101]MCA2296033.1 hypothetical protein [Mycobacterium avium]MCG3245679.1 hypothetical protein [Mycobacterium avium subsp. hominissuis]MDO2356073.1 hypothetical protein [Mycobacterium avium subsp. hominissuis]